ncbi:M23 family metallopeptidase [Chloroflexota bacterium]
MVDNHVLLLPKTNYYQWVKATQVYALAFSVPITPNPIKAGSYDNVTVVIAPDAYPFEGDIIAWLGEHFPAAVVDPLKAKSPEDLVPILKMRVDAALRYGHQPLEDAKHVPEADRQALAKTPAEAVRLELYWPTDYAKVTQEFGVNPEIYSKYGLPGHEGIDIRAPMNSSVYACAAGEVYRAEKDPDAHPYGKHVRIRHAGGYRTVYAHLARITVSEGQRVRPGQMIGKADSTGNSTGSHLHLTLKKDGATARKETHFKGDVIDPTPFMKKPQVDSTSPGEAAAQSYPWTKPCLVGLNLPESGTMEEADFELARTARLEAVKLQENTPAAVITQLREEFPSLFIMARISYDMEPMRVLPGQWVAHVAPHMDRLYQLGLRYYEVHQSPNLSLCGWNYSWHSGGGFGRWWMDVVGQLRDRYDGSWFGFPGLSPGPQVEGQRLDSQTFLEQADEAIQTADWIGVNCFWSDDEEMDDPLKGAFYETMRQRYPDKLLFITEFANVNAITNPYVKGNQYVEYYQRLRHKPGIGAAFSQVMFSPDTMNSLRWRDREGELNRIPEQVGKRAF